MEDKSLNSTLKAELEKELFTEGLLPEQINNILDRAEILFSKSFKSGYRTAQLFSNQEWSNNACLGYVILGAQRLGFTGTKITEIVRATNGQFDLKTIDEARKIYESSPY